RRSPTRVSHSFNPGYEYGSRGLSRGGLMRPAALGASLLERARKIADQIAAVLDPHRDANELVGNAHFRPSRRPHFPENRVRHRNRERSRVAEIRRRDDDGQPIENVET